MDEAGTIWDIYIWKEIYNKRNGAKHESNMNNELGFKTKYSKFATKYNNKINNNIAFHFMLTDNILHC